MYVRRRTWLENGPACLVPKSLPASRPGLGAWLDPEYCASGWSLLDPLAWVGCLPRDAASVYESVQYGHIPRAGELPTAPGPNAPQTAQQAANWDPSQAAVTPANQSAWVAAQQAALVRAEASGSWNPQGNLPVSADGLDKFFKDYGSALLVGGLVLGGVVLWQTRR